MHPGQFQGCASYALTKEEKEIFFEVLFSIKVPTGFLSNIKGIVNMKDKKFLHSILPPAYLSGKAAWLNLRPQPTMYDE
jgi:hypothetical protein